MTKPKASLLDFCNIGSKHKKIKAIVLLVQTILNYLRDGWALLPSSAEQHRELLQELRFYQVPQQSPTIQWSQMLVNSCLLTICPVCCPSFQVKRPTLSHLQLTGMESWLRTQQLLSDRVAGGSYGVSDLAEPLSPSFRIQAHTMDGTASPGKVPISPSYGKHTAKQ